jgi:hypothetical protein
MEALSQYLLLGTEMHKKLLRRAGDPAEIRTESFRYDNQRVFFFFISKKRCDQFFGI